MDVEAQVREIETNTARQDEQIKTLFKRLDGMEQLTQSVHKLATSVELLASAQKSTDKKIDAISADVDEMKQKPAKRWDSILGVIITAVVTAVVTFVLTRIGLK